MHTSEISLSGLCVMELTQKEFYNSTVTISVRILTWHIHVILPFVLYLSQWYHIARFIEGQTNVMVASDVLEEGIDIPKCNLVVKFDTPKNYRSYIQSKGRARYRSSKYYIMVPRDKGGTFHATFQNYQHTENAVRNVSINLVTICT